MSNPDPAWSLGNDDDFVLEDDENFGVGDLEGGDLPPFDDSALAAPANETSPLSALAGEDPFGLDAPAVVHAPLPVMARDEGRTTEQPVPRITIHATCDRHEISDIISGISADRRMGRAEITVEQGGIDAAITRFAGQASPNLLIIDTLLQGAGMLHALDRLAQVIEEGTKVVIIGAVNDIALFRELMSRGVSEYIVPPLQPLDLIRTICGLYVNPDKPFAGRVISVIGAQFGHPVLGELNSLLASLRHSPDGRALSRLASLWQNEAPLQLLYRPRQVILLSPQLAHASPQLALQSDFPHLRFLRK